MTWLFLTIVSYFFAALVATIDKFLVSKKIPQPISYTFYIGILSIFSLLLIFIGGLVFPTTTQFFISFLTGALFILALLFFFQSLKINEPSRVIPLVGSFIPVFSFVLSFFILDEKFSGLTLIALCFLILGGFLIAIVKYKGKEWFIQGWFFVILASLFFAFSFVLSKVIYLQLPFISGFIWIRFGSFIFSLGFLLIGKWRKIIFDSLKTTEKKVSLLFLSNQGFSAFAFILLNLAISLVSVPLINALQGLQYIFIFFFALIISKKFSYLFQEELEKKVILQKIIAIILILIGLFILSFAR